MLETNSSVVVVLALLQLRDDVHRYAPEIANRLQA
jgi:hypothetical protein